MLRCDEKWRKVQWWTKWLHQRLLDFLCGILLLLFLLQNQWRREIKAACDIYCVCRSLLIKPFNLYKLISMTNLGNCIQGIRRRPRVHKLLEVNMCSTDFPQAGKFPFEISRTAWNDSYRKRSSKQQIDLICRDLIWFVGSEPGWTKTAIQFHSNPFYTWLRKSALPPGAWLTLFPLRRGLLAVRWHLFTRLRST